MSYRNSQLESRLTTIMIGVIHLYILFICIFYLFTGISYKYSEDIIDSDIIGYKELYFKPLHKGKGISFKFNKRVVGWASDPYLKKVGGETIKYDDGTTITNNLIVYMTRDKHYFKN